MAAVKVYIAASCQDSAQRLAKQIQRGGHEVISRWVFSKDFGAPTDSMGNDRRAQVAADDLEDVRNCDALVLIAERYGVRVRGGKHVETGMALAWGKRVVLLGAREHIFHWLPQVEMANDDAGVVQIISYERKQDDG